VFVVGPIGIVKNNYIYQMELNAVQKAALLPNEIVSQPAPILSLSDIVNTLNVVVAQETADKSLLDTLVAVNESDVRDRLVRWGAVGFPATHVLYSLQFNRPERCSDGVIRNDVMDYLHFLQPDVSIAMVLTALETRLPGMSLSYSYSNDFVLRIHVSRKD
jgi:hypothetical protein